MNTVIKHAIVAAAIITAAAHSVDRLGGGRAEAQTRESAVASPSARGDDAGPDDTSGYADVNGLKMYYEIRGSGRPLVLLHGGLSTIESTFGGVLPTLAKTRRVIAVEQQGHGHTADIDRPLTYEQMADDTDSLLQQLRVQNADFFGWSDGANVAMQIAIRHPARVGRLVLLGGSFDHKDALGPEILAWLESAKPEDFEPEPRQSYAKVAPDPSQWPTLFAKWKRMQLGFKGVQPEALRAVQAPVLVMAGDRGGDRPEHAAKLFRLFPNAQLAVLPGTSHFALMEHPDWILSMIPAFLDAPMPEAVTAGEEDPKGNLAGKVVSKDGTAIAYDRSGKGPVLILVAGALSDRSGAARLAALLAPHFSVINYDRRGRGESGDTRPYAVQREVEDIEALIDEAGGSAFVFGSSSGAALALEATSRLASKIRKQALFEPPFIVDDSRPAMPEGLAKHSAELVSAGRRGDAVEYFMTEAVRVPPEMVAGMKQSAMWPRLEKLAHTLEYDGTIMGDTLAGKPLPAGRWASATAPTLVIDGGASEAWLRASAKALADALPNARLRTLEGRDHSATFTDPEAFVPVLVEFFAR